MKTKRQMEMLYLHIKTNYPNSMLVVNSYLVLKPFFEGELGSANYKKIGNRVITRYDIKYALNARYVNGDTKYIEYKKQEYKSQAQVVGILMNFNDKLGEHYG